MRGKWKKKKKCNTIVSRLLLHTSSLELRSLSRRFFFFLPILRHVDDPRNLVLPKNLIVPVYTTNRKLHTMPAYFSYERTHHRIVHEQSASTVSRKFENSARRSTRMVHFWYNVIILRACVISKLNVMLLAQQLLLTGRKKQKLCARIKISCFWADGS